MTHLPKELTQRLLAFRAERDWQQFHNARSQAIALSVEAAELLEHFIWARDAEVAAVVEQRRGEIEDELADVAMLIVECALRRKESRGLHYVLDYPERDDRELRDSVVALGDVEPRLEQR